jgi:hypothetical protein
VNIANGNELSNKSHRQPQVDMTKSAKIASNAAPTAQNDSIRTTHFALWASGKNSAKRVTLKKMGLIEAKEG